MKSHNDLNANSNGPGGLFEMSKDELVYFYDQQMSQLEKELLNYNPFDMIASISFIELAQDAETYREGASGIFPLVELVAWAYLKYPFSSGCCRIGTESLSYIREKAKNIVLAVPLLLSQSEKGKSDSIGMLSSLTVLDGLFLRNPGYPHHGREAIRASFHELNSWLSTFIGLTIEDILNIEEAVKALVSNKLTSYRLNIESTKRNILLHLKSSLKNNRSIPKEYEEYRSICKNKKINENIFEEKIYNHFFNGLGQAMSFTVNELAHEKKFSVQAINQFLGLFSLQFSEQELMSQRFNPSHQLKYKPFVSHEGRYICPNPNLSLWAIAPRLEQLLNPGGRASINRDAKKWEKYLISRSKYLEKESVRLLAKALNTEVNYESLEYKLEIDGKVERFEVDGLIIYDDVLFVIEAKSGSLTPPAQRGGVERLLTHLKSNVIEAHNQSFRTKEYVQNTAIPDFYFKNKEKLIIDKNKIREIYMINVSLDASFEMFGVRMNEVTNIDSFNLNKDKQFPWFISLYSLRVVCEMIEFPSQLIHYLRDRIKLYRNDKLQNTDELDFFGCYLLNEIKISDVLEHAEREGIGWVDFGTYTDAFDRYYLYEIGLRKTITNKPTQYMPPKFRMLMKEIHSLAGHSEIACALLDLNDDLRNSFCHAIEAAKKKSRIENKFVCLGLTNEQENVGIFSMAIPDLVFDKDYLKYEIRSKLIKARNELQHGSFYIILSVARSSSLVKGIHICRKTSPIDEEVKQIVSKFLFV